MNGYHSVFLVGPMGAGKTTIGRMLAVELGLPFKDTDKEIEDRTGADIAWIFDVEGEQGFRDRESAMLADLTGNSAIVLATGGGIVLREENRHLLRSRGFVVYLETSVEQQIERTARDRKRPLLQTEEPKRVLKQLMEIRAPLYQSVADLLISTDAQTPRLVAREIAAHFSKSTASI